MSEDVYDDVLSEAAEQRVAFVVDYLNGGAMNGLHALAVQMWEDGWVADSRVLAGSAYGAVGDPIMRMMAAVLSHAENDCQLALRWGDRFASRPALECVQLYLATLAGCGYVATDAEADAAAHIDELLEADDV